MHSRHTCRPARRDNHTAFRGRALPQNCGFPEVPHTVRRPFPSSCNVIFMIPHSIFPSRSGIRGRSGRKSNTNPPQTGPYDIPSIAQNLPREKHPRADFFKKFTIFPDFSSPGAGNRRGTCCRPPLCSPPRAANPVFCTACARRTVPARTRRFCRCATYPP